MKLDAFWSSERWHAYERAYGDAPGTRAALLASAPFSTRVIDLRPETQQARVAHRLVGDPLWPFVRKSYHALINGGMRRYSIQPLGPMIRDDLEGPRELHRREAGRETRHAETWMLMANWVRDEQAICIVGFDHQPSGLLAGEPFSARGFAYFIIDGAWAYYASAATIVPNLNHALVWNGILNLRKRGVRWCEMGWQGEAWTDKGKTIEFFRRGFGGVDMPVTAELP